MVVSCYPIFSSRWTLCAASKSTYRRILDCKPFSAYVLSFLIYFWVCSYAYYQRSTLWSRLSCAGFGLKCMILYIVLCTGNATLFLFFIYFIFLVPPIRPSFVLFRAGNGIDIAYPTYARSYPISTYAVSVLISSRWFSSYAIRRCFSVTSVDANSIFRFTLRSFGCPIASDCARLISAFWRW